MALNLYRRHFRKEGKCMGGHEADSRSYEADELRRGWKQCTCPIYASGTLGGRFDRKNTEQTGWDEAKLIASRWETAGNWEGLPPAPVLAPPPTVLDPGRITIQYATEQYLGDHRANGSARGTIDAYTERTNAFKNFSESKGYVMLDQWQTADVREYRASWNNGPRTRANKLNWLKVFFNYFVAQEWITVSPAAPFNNRGFGKNRAALTVQKSPFTDAELDRIFEACQKLPPHPWFNGWGKGEWSGRDVADFIAVSVYTGLRISDIVQFNTDRLTGSRCFLRQHKTGKPLYTRLPDWLCERLRERAAEHGPHIFGQFHCKTKDARTMAEVWRAKIRMAFDLAAKEKPFDRKPTPHRFRHTFVRVLLQHGVEVEDVAELAGDTPDVIRKHYAEWCPERQERLDRILQEAFAERPVPKLIVMPGGHSSRYYRKTGTESGEK